MHKIMFTKISRMIQNSDHYTILIQAEAPHNIWKLEKKIKIGGFQLNKNKVT